MSPRAATTDPLRLAEALGLTPPLRTRLSEASRALLGEPDLPRSTWGLSSVRQLRPRLGPRLWAGRFVVPRTAIVTNLVNHTPTPRGRGYSTRRTQVRDFRGRQLTYDSHQGTDFCVPVGTTVTAAAPGRVVRISSEFDRGGLKLFVDHGGGLMTCTAHLGRSLVRVGDGVTRGQPVALSGYAGVDGLLTFPWGAPHIHFNVWHDGRPVDPFPHSGHVSMWRAGARPTPGAADHVAHDPSQYDRGAVDKLIDLCTSSARRRALAEHDVLWRRAADLLAEINYYPTRFPDLRCSLYQCVAARHPLLDLPFDAAEIDRMMFFDEL